VAENITDMVPTTNPFLKDLLSTFLTVGGRKGKIDFDELGINEVVHALRNANMEAVLRDFGDRNPQEDPVIHFYELFLKEYNPKLRMQRGVFYTPKPIVSFIVRSVDEILCTEFGLEDGLADTTTWGEMLKRLPEVKLPKDTEPKEPFVQILDPALGTGTFLVEVIDIIHKTMITKWQKAGYSISKQQQLWNEYVPKHLLPRLYGFELLMAPYTIAHMKIGLKLWETGYRFGSDERAHIYLTNSLEPAVDIQMDLPDLLPALAHEAQAANSVKRHKRFTVVIGNPPYSGISANRNDWIETLLKGRDLSGRKTANYYEVNGASIGEKKVWLQDDYVKFVRLSHFLIEEAGMGVHGMITNHSFVDSPTCRGLRFQLARFFSVMHFVDLHGSTKKSEVAPEDIIDENVFDILPGVAVSLCARASLSRHMTIGSFDLWGTREDKFTWLLGHSMDSVHWMPLSLSEPYYLFVNRQLDFDAEYYGFYSLKDIFSFYGTGVQTSRDEFATDYVRKDLEDRLCAFFSREQSDKTIGEKFGVSDTRGWKIREIRRTSNFAKVSEHITQYLFRIFDTKWVALTKDIVDWPRFDVISCVGPNRPGLLCSRQQATPGFRHAFVVNMPVDMFCISNKSREGQTVFPLFACTEGSFFQSKSDTKWKLNFGQQFAEDSFRLLHPSVTHGECKSLSEEDGFQILAYLYAILHSAIYRARYVDLLKMDYPRLPLTSNMKLFITLARLGGELITLHLIESPKVNRYITKFLGDENPEVEKIFYSDSTVWIDKAQTIGFKGVPEDVWNFHIGGYQVCEKWLKDRKGRRLTKDDIEHYQKIVVALNETIRLMTEIDKVIEKHGGWPGAFNTSNICETE
jgi:predicted helicase